MEAGKFGIKFFATEPLSDLRKLVPVFHSWIQRQAVDDHLLIDVHDYSHIHNGPGILLVAHEGNFSMDMGDGRLGLLYHRKQPMAGDLEERLARLLKIALQACGLLAEQNIRFITNECLIVVNDRLRAPNSENTFEELRPVISSALSRVFPAVDFTITRHTEDPKERFAVHMKL